jgi:molybdopterin/thiamine biosynthesis adenylyltransferase
MSFKNEHLTRQMDIIPMDILGEKITIIGAGAIGGWTTLALAKMGFCNITVYDFDKVDTVNLNSQFYRRKDIGKPKVAALQELVEDFTGVKIEAYETRYSGGIFPGIVIAAVDSMEVRRLVWAQHANKSPFTKAVIDPRMGAETALLYVMRPMNLKDQTAYEKTLYSDSEAVQERCTAKATIYTANLLSGLAVKAVKDLLTRPDYLRSAQWDIAQNDLLCFKAKEDA